MRERREGGYSHTGEPAGADGPRGGSCEFTAQSGSSHTAERPVSAATATATAATATATTTATAAAATAAAATGTAGMDDACTTSHPSSRSSKLIDAHPALGGVGRPASSRRRTAARPRRVSDDEDDDSPPLVLSRDAHVRAIHQKLGIGGASHSQLGIGGPDPSPDPNPSRAVTERLGSDSIGGVSEDAAVRIRGEMRTRAAAAAASSPRTRHVQGRGFARALLDG